MKRFDGVSVIVPIYNVEKYLDKCVESLLDQTIDNYEVLLIDDGSTDNSPKMCDEYAKKYKDKIKVFHKKNGGLSDARNYGIDKASGEYLMFVDSDDWVSSNFVELPYKKAKEGYDIVSFDAISINDGATTGWETACYRGKNMSKKEFMLNSTDPAYAWARIYHYTLFDIVKYPKPDIWYEDVATTPILMSFAKNMTHINEYLYYYRQRQTSISHIKNSPRILGLLTGIERVLKLCNKEYLKEASYAVYKNLNTFMWFRPAYIDEYLDFAKKNSKYFKDNEYILKDIKDKKINNLLEMEVIPKKLHFFWFGPKKPESVLRCIESWKKYAPDYEIIEWNESNCDVNAYEYTKEAYENKKYAFVSDFFRIKVLYEEGGIYLDTDMELYDSIDFLRLNKAFFPFETNNVCAGIVGCIKGHPLIKEWLDMYDGIHFVKEDGTLDTTTIVERLTKVLNRHYKIKYNGLTAYFDDRVTIYSPAVLIINIYNGENICEHHYDASWWNVEKGKWSYKYEVIKYYFENYPKEKEKLLFRIKRFILNGCRKILNKVLPKSGYKKIRNIYRKIKPSH
ncbi:MAG: glycosyltransferase [Bacilli bacterium]|nr:glycosyltransferase [Bacilli bacterium]